MPRISSLITVPKSPSPHFFYQRVVHSDGSSFVMRTTTPKALLQLTKDTRNHILWNPANNIVDDRTGELSKFTSRFGDLSSFDDLALDASAFNAVPKKKVVPPKPAASGGAAAAPKKKK
ncbi:hypothetical protein HDU77_009000 [Chytriomyces hyalinus]|nr:hypothetical protein HDU77_009000 [Chytriomyces hyalinus]